MLTLTAPLEILVCGPRETAAHRQGHAIYRFIQPPPACGSLAGASRSSLCAKKPMLVDHTLRRSFIFLDFNEHPTYIDVEIGREQSTPPSPPDPSPVGVSNAGSRRLPSLSASARSWPPYRSPCSSPAPSSPRRPPPSPSPPPLELALLRAGEASLQKPSSASLPPRRRLPPPHPALFRAPPPNTPPSPPPPPPPAALSPKSGLRAGRSLPASAGPATAAAAEPAAGEPHMRQESSRLAPLPVRRERGNGVASRKTQREYVCMDLHEKTNTQNRFRLEAGRSEVPRFSCRSHVA